MCADNQTVPDTSNHASDKMSTTETALGDLFADAIRESVKADIGLIASSEIRSKGTVSITSSKSPEEISSLVNYPEDTVTVIQITGKQLTAALEQSVSSYPKPTLRFLQVSGLSFTFNPAKAQGSRVTKVTIGEDKLVPLNTYKVAVTRSLARGALGYWKVWSRNNIKAPDSPPTVVDAVSNYLKQNTSLDYTKLDRIIIAGQTK
jgi:2',3'-cyclic-nucleotide 2'-phosphodiesterase (5'-nucleotidase family)